MVHLSTVSKGRLRGLNRTAGHDAPIARPLRRRRIAAANGPTFYLCERSLTDPRYPQIPALAGVVVPRLRAAAGRSRVRPIR